MTSEATLADRAEYLYRRLVLLQHVFQPTDENDSVTWLNDGDAAGSALRAAIREVLDDLAEQALVLTKTPHPIREWRPGDVADDERWRALTDIERREVLSLASAYENLVAWCETQQSEAEEVSSPTDLHFNAKAARAGTSDRPDFLAMERARITRFRREMAFLDRRRIAESA